MAEDTSTRVQSSTERQINARIARQTEANIAYFSRRLDEIECRLAELDEEWDIERTLQMNAAAVGLAGLALSLIWRRFLLAPIAVLGFLAQHALQGWCPPVSLFRRLGVRTAREIDHERYALKGIRGDFRQVMPDSAEDTQERAAKAMQSAAPTGGG